MRLDPKKCPCGCSKVILDPVCGCQCSSVRPEKARDLMVRVNYHERLVAALRDLLQYPAGKGPRIEAESLLELIEKASTAPPDFPEFGYMTGRR